MFCLRLEAIATTSNKKLLGTKGIATRSKDATRAPGRTTRNEKLLGAPGLATRNKKLLITSASLLEILFLCFEALCVTTASRGIDCAGPSCDLRGLRGAQQLLQHLL